MNRRPIAPSAERWRARRAFDATSAEDHAPDDRAIPVSASTSSRRSSSPTTNGPEGHDNPIHMTRPSLQPHRLRGWPFVVSGTNTTQAAGTPPPPSRPPARPDGGTRRCTWRSQRDTLGSDSRGTWGVDRRTALGSVGHRWGSVSYADDDREVPVDGRPLMYFDRFQVPSRRAGRSRFPLNSGKPCHPGFSLWASRPDGARHACAARCTRSASSPTLTVHTVAAINTVGTSWTGSTRRPGRTWRTRLTL